MEDMVKVIVMLELIFVEESWAQLLSIAIAGSASASTFGDAEYCNFMG